MTLEMKWKRGMKVTKVFHGVGGYREETEGTVTKVDHRNQIVYVDDEFGITYDAAGKERENFFPPMRCEIIAKVAI